jgi:hypothetical protein
MAIKPGEKVLVITDDPLRNIGYALCECAKKIGAEDIIVEIIPRGTRS